MQDRIYLLHVPKSYISERMQFVLSRMVLYINRPGVLVLILGPCFNSDYKLECMQRALNIRNILMIHR